MKTTQRQKILDYINKWGSITSYQAFIDLGITQLATRIKELKEPCRSAIANGRCKGCVGLAEKDWEEPSKCPYLLTSNENIKQIKMNL